MAYKILKPCVITSADGKSATHHRRVDSVVEIPNKEQADDLEAKGFVQAVKGSAPEQKSDKADKPA